MAPLQEHYDVVVVGAGFAGLVNAHRYLCLNPNASLVMLDRNTNVGGTWSRDRIYPGFYAQFVTGLAEYSDLKMPEPLKDESLGDFFQANHMTKYLEEYASKMVHGGKDLHARFHRAEIESIERAEDNSTDGAAWRISVRDLAGHDDVRTITEIDGEIHVDPIQIGDVPLKTLRAKKVIVATGAFSTPNYPPFKNQPSFSAPIIHSTNFGESDIIASSNIKHVAVLGAGKSAADMIYSCLKNLPPDTQVHWIIREDGTGPGFFAAMDIPSPGYKNPVEIANTGLMGALQPSLHNQPSWWQWALHQTKFGMGIVNWVFSQVDIETKKRAQYQTRGEDAKARGFDKLEYSPGIFWQNGAGGMQHHLDFWDRVAERVIVHRAHVTGMEHHKLQLSNDKTIDCDALLLGTGWTSSLTYFTPELSASLGIPHDPSATPAEQQKHWASLDATAQKDVLIRFPLLKSPPEHVLKESRETPYRLYRGIAPISDFSARSIVFVNFWLCGNMIMNAEAQAIWAAAYLTSSPTLTSRLPHSQSGDVDTMQLEAEVARQVVWCKKRYLSVGQLGNYAGFDGMAYTDALCRDLGVEKAWRRKGTFGVRRPEDLGEAWRLFVEGEAKR